MKYAFTFVVLFSAASSMAADYTCRGNFAHDLLFNLHVLKTKVTLSNGGGSCGAVIDPSYRPTVKYAGYVRFKSTSSTARACRLTLEAMLGQGNSFDSLKVSKELQTGRAVGPATIVIDDGDYHGQLRNERLTCKAN